jgi:mono/diheme cytochrome c family protein
MFRSWLLAVAVALPLSTAHAQTPAAPAPPASSTGTVQQVQQGTVQQVQQGTVQQVQQGKDLFVKYSCYACHGYNGQGSGNGARLVPMRMNAVGFANFVRNPGRMPPYGSQVLSDAQLADLFAFIRSLPGSPQAKDIPLLAKIIGEARPARRP